jgi:hypothetical protein
MIFHRKANLVFYSWLRSKQHIKKSELHDLLQGRILFYVYIDWTTWCNEEIAWLDFFNRM